MKQKREYSVPKLISKKLEHYFNVTQLEDRFDSSGKGEFRSHPSFLHYDVAYELHQKNAERNKQLLYMEEWRKSEKRREMREKENFEKRIAKKKQASSDIVSETLSVAEKRHRIKSASPSKEGLIKPSLINNSRRKILFSEAERIVENANDVFKNTNVQKIERLHRYLPSDKGCSKSNENIPKNMRVLLHEGSVMKVENSQKFAKRLNENRIAKLHSKHEESKDDNVLQSKQKRVLNGTIEELLPKGPGTSDHIPALLKDYKKHKNLEQSDDYIQDDPVVIEVEPEIDAKTEDSEHINRSENLDMHTNTTDQPEANIASEEDSEETKSLQSNEKTDDMKSQPQQNEFKSNQLADSDETEITSNNIDENGDLENTFSNISHDAIEKSQAQNENSENSCDVITKTKNIDSNGDEVAPHDASHKPPTQYEKEENV